MADVTITTNTFSGNTGDSILVPELNVSNITAGLDQAGDDYAELIIVAGYMKALGASGSPLKCTADLLRYYGGGSFYLEADDDNGAGGEAMDDVFIEAMKSDVKVGFTQAAAVHADCDWHRIRLARGAIDIGASLTWAAAGRVDIGYVNDVRGDCRVKINNGNTLPVLNMGGGTVVCETTVTRGTVSGGRLTVDVAPVTTLEINAGGHVNYNHSAGTLIIVNSGGSLDLTQKNEKKTITDIWLMPGSQYKSIPDLLTATVHDLRRIAA